MNATSETPVNDGTRNSDRSSIAFSRFASITRKASRSSTAPPSDSTIGALPHPSALPRISPKISRNRPAEKLTTPGTSIGCGSVAFTFASLVSVSTIAAMPIGTLTKKIHSHPRPSVISPPISGPTATAPPTVAPQIPIALARSRPSNSCAISARAVANIAAAPVPWTPRARLRTVGSPASPQANEAAVNRAKPKLNTRRRPIRSPTDPATSRNDARVSA